ncbi:nickel-dependent hydrogenase large subunit [Tropicibacter naphthalenivorans]|uniref:Periplasmic [NiFeSe] hydrogenase large subunit n=1 Tax=Tropicibacter naphthalenivorans TaxID=441103 RepID=A0A0P1G2B2_9RHOB|nr:nickel-dependent hydrogenase large subunit [Tropicibacter naphthalenivorans]CUH75934.1 Periplasmic [NiFeSe] hydrogenase large subunit [Tropicibacter naphthalenivorans]SMC41157.1 hydrogenase large subunit [Tropicibacter naphthalenivorans]
MSETQLLVGPFNRVEGDLEVRLDVSEGQVQAAYVNSPLFRGFERMLLGKGPLDALTITPRICGICSISQSAAAAFALADAAGGLPAPMGARVAALLHMVENQSDHMTHFNLFFMPDFARPGYAGRAWHDRVVDRFTAVKGAGLHAAVDARARLLHIVGMLGGKWPHTLAIQPGGVTRAPSSRDKIRIKASLTAFRKYLEGQMFGAPLETFAELATLDQLNAWETGDIGLFNEVSQDLRLDQSGIGAGRYLSFGAYPGPDGHVFKRGTLAGETPHPLDETAITEDVSHAWMLGGTQAPLNGQTLPDEAMREDAYSWCKAPRLDGLGYETGALARQAIDGHPLALALAAEASVRARVMGRLLELARAHIAAESLLDRIIPSEPFMAHIDLPRDGTGVGLVEAARGALGHWLRIEDGQIANYQIIAPTTWNFSPRDAQGVPGPLEAALVGAEVREGEDAPLSVQHIVRSFDPCMVCTVH